MLRVLCRYLKRVSDRSPLTTDQCRYNWDADAVLSLRPGYTIGGSMGRELGDVWGGGRGGVIRGATRTHPCAWTPTVGPPRGRGPRPLLSLSGPLPLCNTVWHTHPRLIICPAAVALFDTPA